MRGTFYFLFIVFCYPGVLLSALEEMHLVLQFPVGQVCL